jgi:hypothetical protein
MTSSVQFGHGNSERLLIRNVSFDVEGWYSATADLRSGTFQGTIEIAGFKSELSELVQELQVLSRTMQGSTTFKNLEGQLRLKCSIGPRGTITYNPEITDLMNHKLMAEFESDFPSLEATISSLLKLLQG